MNPPAPTVSLVVLLPVLAPALGALLILLLDAVAPATRRISGWVAGLALLAGAAGPRPLGLPAGGASRTLCLPGEPQVCLAVVDRLAAGLQALALLAGLIALLLAVGAHSAPASGAQGAAPDPAAPDHTGCDDAAPDSTLAGLVPDRTVPLALLLTAVAGANTLAMARDLSTLVVGLELVALPLVLLVAQRHGARGIVAATDLLLSSLGATALLALGAACWYAATGTLLLTGEAVLAAGQQSGAGGRPVLALAVLLLVAGLGVKLALAPFHGWAPQVYRDSPGWVVALLAGVGKIAAVAGLIAVLRPLVAAREEPVQALVVLALASMTWGSLALLRTRSATGLLAWSSVAQAGWVLLPLTVLTDRSAAAAVAYAGTVVLATLALIGALSAVVTDWGSRGASGLAGMGRRAPLAGLAAGLALLTLAGLPPGLAGLVVKIGVLRPLVDAGLWLPALLAGANIVLGIAGYTRWLALIVRQERGEEGAPAGEPAGESAAPARPHPATVAGAALAAALLVAVTAAPQILSWLTRP